MRIYSFLLAILFIAGCTSGSEPDAPTPEALAEETAATTNTLGGSVALNPLTETADPTITQILTVVDSIASAKIYAVPDLNAEVTYEFSSVRQPPGSTAFVPTVFTVVPNPTTPKGWWNINLPVKPNGSTGWIRAEDVTLSFTDLRVEIDRSGFNLRVIDGNQVIINETVAIGTGAAATPVGEFFVTELLASTNPFYGPFAFGLSGFSEQLTEFNGEDAIIGIHGTNDPSSIGTEASSGCVRLPNDVIERLAEILPLGTPVTIT